jgi:hypothetical protein
LADILATSAWFVMVTVGVIVGLVLCMPLMLILPR